MAYWDNLLDDLYMKDRDQFVTTEPSTPLSREQNPTVVDTRPMPSLAQLVEANTANMGRKQQLDFNASRQGQPAPVPVPSPQESLDAQSTAEGWQPVKGLESFMQPGASGRFRAESDITPEGERAMAAADSLRAFNQNKYGGTGTYGGGGADVLNPSETIATLGRQAYEATSGKRMRLEDDIAKLQSTLEQGVLAGQQGTPQFAELAQQLQTLQGMATAEQKSADMALAGSIGTASDIFAPMEEMMKEDRQRQEYGQLAAMLGGNANAFPGGMSKETYGQVDKVRKAQNEERRLDNQDRTYDLAVNRNQRAQDAATRPKQPSAAMVKMHAQSMLPPGTTVARMNGADVLVKVGTQEIVPDGDRILKQATQQAYQKLLGSGGGSDPTVTQNPSVQGIAPLVKIVKSGGQLRPDQQIIYDRFEMSRVQAKKFYMSIGMDERAAAAKAITTAAESAVGLR